MKDLFFKTIMLKGEAGGTIASIEKTSSELNVDTYTITLNDGETTTFEVTNGTSIASISKTGTSGLVDTYTITLTDGSTTTFEVTNGEDAYYYELPSGAVVYFDSEDPTPQGYESTVNPNAAAIAALQDSIENMDNNLLINSNFAAISKGGSDGAPGWTFTADQGSSAALGFIPNTGFVIPAGVHGTLASPIMTDMSNTVANYIYDLPNTLFSVSVLFRSFTAPVGQEIPLTLATLDGLDPSSLNDRKYTLPDIFEFRVVSLYGGGKFTLHVNNLSSDYGIMILAIKLEIGSAATPIRAFSPLNGLGKVIEPYIPKIKMVALSKSFSSGAALVDPSDLGLTSSDTIVSVMATVNYASGQTPTLIATTQIQSNGVNIYLRDITTGTYPADGTYVFTILANYR